jgi:hypothetical protein
MTTRNTVDYVLDTKQPPALTAAQKAEVEALAALPDEEIDTSEIAPLTEAFWQNAVRNPFFRPVKRGRRSSR